MPHRDFAGNRFYLWIASFSRRPPLRPNKSLVVLPLLLVLAGCFEDSGTSSPAPSYATVAEWTQTGNATLPGDANLATGAIEPRWDSVVDLSAHAALVRQDLQSILADWNARRPVASQWEIVATDSSDRRGRTHLVRFSVDGIAQGGLVWIPKSDKPLPVVLFGHPGDNGISSLFFTLLRTLMGGVDSQVVVVAPAYRGETASLGSSSVESDTSRQSPWDRDVDDGLAFLEASLQQFPSCDPTRIAAVGYSRGAGVSLLSALREPSIGSVFQIAGPTDFFAPSLQGIALGLLGDKTYDLPGLDYLNTKYLQPFKSGAIPADSLRRVLLRRSAARWALSGQLPATQTVHGTADSTVNPDQAQALVAADRRVAYLKIQGMTHTSFLSPASFSQSSAISTDLQKFLKANLRLN